VRTARVVLALALGTLLALAAAELVARGVTWLRHGTTGDRGGYGDVFLEHHPRLGWLGIPGRVVRHHTTELDVELAINAAGFRQAAPPPLQRTPGVRRVVLLGDSFVFGQGVDESERLGDLLARDVERCEAASLGLPGWGTDQALLAWSELDGAHRNADVVVLVYPLEHVLRNVASVRHGRPKPRFERKGGSLRLVGVPVPDWSDAPPQLGAGPTSPRTWLKRHSRLYALLAPRARAILRRLSDGPPRDPYPQYAQEAPAWQLTRALLGELDARVRARGARLAVLVVPEARHLAPGFPAAAQRVVLAACASLSIPALDLTSPLRAAREAGGDALYFPVDGHWTPAGHAVAARELERLLRDACLL